MIALIQNYLYKHKNTCLYKYKHISVKIQKKKQNPENQNPSNSHYLWREKLVSILNRKIDFQFYTALVDFVDMFTFCFYT